MVEMQQLHLFHSFHANSVMASAAASFLLLSLFAAYRRVIIEMNDMVACVLHYERNALEVYFVCSLRERDNHRIASMRTALNTFRFYSLSEFRITSSALEHYSQSY